MSKINEKIDKNNYINKEQDLKSNNLFKKAMKSLEGYSKKYC